MFSRRQQLVLGSFLLMAAATWGLDRYLTGGTDAAIIGSALEKLKTNRHFAGSVSVVSSIAVEGAGRQAVITVAKGRFGLPPGKTLAGAWTVTVQGAAEEAVADLAEVDMAVPGDGKMYLRPKHVSEALDLKIFPKSATNRWVAMAADSLWTAPASERLDAAAAWQSLFESFVSGSDFLVPSRELSEPVAGEPCWHFSLGLLPTAVATYGETFERLRLGRDLTADEKLTMAGNFAKAAPQVDLWVAKRSGEARQVIMSYISHAEGLTPQPVVVTVQLAAYPPFETVANPLAAANETASSPRP